MDNLNFLQHLFISKVRITLLKIYLFDRERAYHIREITRISKEELNAVRRELIRLASIGFLKATKVANKVQYSLSKDFIFLGELESMFMKTYGLGSDLAKNKAHIGNIKFAFLKEAFLEGQKSTAENLDFVIIGEVDLVRLDSMIERIQKEIGKELNYTIMSAPEFDLRFRRNDLTVRMWLLEKKVDVVGDINSHAAKLLN
jgi:hypothetical protein